MKDCKNSKGKRKKEKNKNRKCSFNVKIEMLKSKILMQMLKINLKTSNLLEFLPQNRKLKMTGYR